jgi:tetratricopeptide (TPR) repeat protein
VTLPPEESSALDALGYLSGSQEPAGAGDLPDPKDRIDEVAAMEYAARRMHAGKPEEAEPLLRALVAARPTFLDAHVRLLVALAMQGRDEAALAEAQAIDEVARSVPDGERLAARAHLFIGDLHLEAGRLEEAARAYERALAAPQAPEVHNTLAALYQDLGRREDAIRVLRMLEERGDANERSRALLRHLVGGAASPGSSPPRG